LPVQATSGSPASVTYWPNDYGFNINEHVIVANSSGATGVSTASIPTSRTIRTFGFSQLVTLATIQNSAGFLILTDAARADKVVGRGSLTPQYIDPTNSKNTLSYDPAGWTANGSQAAAASRHLGGFNAGYSDGHVKFASLWLSGAAKRTTISALTLRLRLVADRRSMIY